MGFQICVHMQYPTLVMPYSIRGHTSHEACIFYICKRNCPCFRRSDVLARAWFTKMAKLCRFYTGYGYGEKSALNGSVCSMCAAEYSDAE